MHLATAKAHEELPAHDKVTTKHNRKPLITSMYLSTCENTTTQTKLLKIAKQAVSQLIKPHLAGLNCEDIEPKALCSHQLQKPV